MEEELIKRILPHSDDAERSVIGCMMMNREAIMIASEILTGDEFYRQQMGIVFDSMVELYNEGKPVDFVTLPEKLKEKDVPPEISSMEFAKDLLTAVPTSVNVGHYAKIVKEKAMLRRLIKMNEDIANTCYLDKEPVEEIMEDTEKQLFQLLQTRTGGDYVPIRQVVLNALETIEKASQTKGTVTGIPTGFVDLDYKTSGLQPSDFILVAARPSMGKTAFVLNMAQYMAFRKDKSVAIFSLEMSKEQLVNRSEERRVGKSVDLGGRRIIKKIFFFKQKTAYEILECDWSSDVCSSDLGYAPDAQTSWKARHRRVLQLFFIHTSLR